MSRAHFAFARQIAGMTAAVFAVIMLCCALPQQAVAQGQGGALMAGGATSAQGQGDLQLVGISGIGVSGNAQAGYTVHVRDGDEVTLNLTVRNVSGKELEYVTMTGYPTYEQDGEIVRPIVFSPLDKYDQNEGVTGATYNAAQWLTSETTGVSYPGYSIAAGATATFQLMVKAGDLATGTKAWNIQLGRLRYDFERVEASYNGISYYEWPLVNTEVEEVHSAQIPLTVEVYNQEGAALTVGRGYGFGGVENLLTSAGIDFGTHDLSALSENEEALADAVDIYAINAGTPNAFVDSHGVTTDITVGFGGEATSAAADAIGWGNGTLYDTNWEPLPVATVTGSGETSVNYATYSVGYNAYNLIAGTYTADFIISTTPHMVSINGMSGNAKGEYRFPVTLTLTGTNPLLLPRAEDLVATPGNGQVELTWTPPGDASEYAEYSIYRCEGDDTQTDPDELDWSRYEKIGSKTVGSDGEPLWVDGDAANGVTYSYTVICGEPYHGYAAVPASTTPDASIESRIMELYFYASYGEGCVELEWSMNGKYGGEECSGEGMVDHFNIYRDGVLVDQIFQSAVQDNVVFGWHDDGTGTGTQVYGPTSHEYKWEVKEPVPELYTPYAWTVSAVSPSGVEGYLCDEDVAEGYGPEPVILGHEAYYDPTYRVYENLEEFDDVPAIAMKIYNQSGAYNSAQEITIWKSVGTTQPDTTQPPLITVKGGYNTTYGDATFADKDVVAGQTYTYTARATDELGTTGDFYTFTVKAAGDADQYYASSEVQWSVVGGTMARMQFRIPKGAVAKIYRNGASVPFTVTDTVYNAVVFEDDPGADGTYVYRVDSTTAGVTVRGRDYTFVRNTGVVELADLLQVPDAPTLAGRTSGTGNVVLSWTPAATGGAPEGYHIYRSDAGEQKTGGRYVTKRYWSGSHDVYESWGNGRYISLSGGDTLSFVDGRIADGGAGFYYQGNSHLGDIIGLSWDDDNLPHTYYITAYNRAGESAPSEPVVFATHDEDERGYPIAPANVAEEAPDAPSISKVWIDWDDGSTYQYGFDTAVYGSVRVAWSDSGLGGDIDRWKATFAGTQIEDNGLNPPRTESLEYHRAVLDPAAKLGTSSRSPKCSVNGFSGSSSDLGRMITVTVTAENSAGAAVSEAKTVVVNSLPRFYALPDNGGALLRWTDLTDDGVVQVNSWEVWRKAEFGLWERVADAEVLPAPGDHSGVGKDRNDHDVSYYQWADRELANGWAYEYQVVAKCADGVDRPSVVREVTPERTAATEAPGAPREFKAEVANGIVYLSWKAPEAGGAVSRYYPVYEAALYGYPPDWYTLTWVHGNTTSATWVPSRAGTYSMSVYSLSTIGDVDVPRTKSGYEVEGYDEMTSEQRLDARYPTHSNIVTVTISDDAIASQPGEGLGSLSMTLTPGNGQVTMAWNHCENAVSYRIDRYDASGSRMDDVIIAATQASYVWVDETAEPGVRYRYVLVASGIDGNGRSTEGYATAGGKTRDEIAAERVVALIATLPTAADIEALDAGDAGFEAQLGRYEEQVAAVREVFDSLTAKQKSYVDEAAVEHLEGVTAAIAAKKWADEIASVMALIDAADFPTVEAIAAASEGELDGYAAKVAEARAAYNGLPSEAKLGVDASKLTAAERAIAEARKVIADKKAAAAVADVIEELPDASALVADDREQFEVQRAAIAAARGAYEGLTAAQKGFVDDEALSKLAACEQRAAELAKAYNDAETASPVIAAIDAIPDPATDGFTLTCAGDVASARAAYDALTDDQRALVDAAGATTKLEACEVRVAELKEELAHMEAADAAAAVDGLIGAIPHIDDLDNMTLADRPAVREVRDAYESLSDEAKELVKPELLDKLEAAEARIAVLEAEAVEQLIANLPNPSKITLDDEADVVAARAAFDALTEWQQGFLTETAQPKLEACETRIAKLKADAADAARISIADGEVIVGTARYTYSGAPCKPDVALLVGGVALERDVDFTVDYAHNVNAGVATVVLTGIGAYKGEARGTFTIAKAANPLSAKAKAAKVKVKYKKLKKKAQKVAALAVSGARGALTYKIVKLSVKKKLLKQAKKKIKLAAGGKLKLKRKLKKGTYIVTMRVFVSGNANFLPAAKDVTFKIRVK